MSSTGTYTPGPWSIYETAGDRGNIPARMEVVAPESERAKRLIANIYGFKLPEGRANARLIAAAPKLLKELREMLEYTRILRSFYLDDEDLRGKGTMIEEDIERVEALLKRVEEGGE